MTRFPRFALIAERCITALPVLVIVSLLAFFTVSILPGDPAQVIAGPDATPEQVAHLHVTLGLDRPIWERYWDWLADAFRGDLGTSLVSGQPVTTLISDRIPLTLGLTLLALLIAVSISVPLALLAARNLHGVWDRLGMGISMSCLSLASYVLGPALILVFAVNLGLFPSFGFTPYGDSAAHSLRALILPAVTVAAPLLGLYTRFLRCDLLEQMGEPYILTAQSKGIGPWRVLIRHALPNSLPGLLTVIALNIGGLIGSAVIVEQVFSLPGIGQLLLQSLHARDVIVLQAIALLFAAITVIANLAVDVTYTIIDSRVRYARH